MNFIRVLMAEGSAVKTIDLNINNIESVEQYRTDCTIYVKMVSGKIHIFSEAEWSSRIHGAIVAPTI